MRGPFDGEFVVSDLTDRTLARKVRIDALEVTCVSVDGRLLATPRIWEQKVGRNGEAVRRLPDTERIDVWDLQSGQFIGCSNNINWDAQCAAFSPDNRILATGLWPQPELYPYDECRETVRLWGITSGQYITSLKGDLPDASGPGVVRSVAFSLDGLSLAAGSEYGNISLWQTDGWQRLRVLENRGGAITAVAFSHDACLLASGSEAGRVTLWNLSYAARKPHRLEASHAAVNALAFSRDNQFLAAGFQDGLLRVWNIWTGAYAGAHPAWSFGQDGSEVVSVAIPPEGDLVALETEDGLVRICDLATGLELDRLEGGNLAFPSSAAGA